MGIRDFCQKYAEIILTQTIKKYCTSQGFQRFLHSFQLLLSISQSFSMCMSSAVSLLAVIEVASGEYGDLNPVLFEAVQGGLCSDEGKKNSSDKNDATTSCPSQCYNVSDGHTHSPTKSVLLSVSDLPTSIVLCIHTGFRLHWETHFWHQFLHTVLHPLQENLRHYMQGRGKNCPLLLLAVLNILNAKEMCVFRY